MNDDDIDIAALKAGDEEEFAAVVDLFKDRVYTTCLGFLDSQVEAEDAAQEVFLEVYSSIRHFREESQLSTWMHRIAVNKSLEILRAKRRKKRLAMFFTVSGKDPDAIPDHDEEAQPLALLLSNERAGALQQAMAKLPDAQRAAFVLHKVDGLSYKEIGEVLQASIPSVESLIHRAKRNLRKYLYDYYNQHKG